MTTTTARHRADVEERVALGKEAARLTPLSSHADSVTAPDRPDPVELLVQQDATREAGLVPLRHGRMLVTPSAFYRGAARVMAADLARTPTAGLEGQLCGDAQLSNF